MLTDQENVKIYLPSITRSPLFWQCWTRQILPISPPHCSDITRWERWFMKTVIIGRRGGNGKPGTCEETHPQVSDLSVVILLSVFVLLAADNTFLLQWLVPIHFVQKLLFYSLPGSTILKHWMVTKTVKVCWELISTALGLLTIFILTCVFWLFHVWPQRCRQQEKPKHLEC